MHEMCIVSVGYMPYLSIEQYNIQGVTVSGLKCTNGIVFHMICFEISILIQLRFCS